MNDREKIGKHLKLMREHSGFTTYDLVKKGVRFEQIKAIEQGSSNYTIDILLRYLEAIDIEMAFSGKK